MNSHEFVEKYMGQKVDFDGHYGAQCVDLVRQKWKEVDGLPTQPEGVIGAQDFYLKHDVRPIQKQLLDRVEYRPGMIPPVGAAVFFRATPENQYGHVGICFQANERCIFLFEQDGFRQDGAKIKMWPYDRVLGWLLKKQEGQ